jgi:hypothetical protein
VFQDTFKFLHHDTVTGEFWCDAFGTFAHTLLDTRLRNVSPRRVYQDSGSRFLGTAASRISRTRRHECTCVSAVGMDRVVEDFYRWEPFRRSSDHADPCAQFESIKLFRCATTASPSFIPPITAAGRRRLSVMTLMIMNGPNDQVGELYMLDKVISSGSHGNKKRMFFPIIRGFDGRTAISLNRGSFLVCSPD